MQSQTKPVVVRNELTVFGHERRSCSTELRSLLPPDWLNVLADEFEKEYMLKLELFLQQEQSSYRIRPALEEVFAAFCMTPFDQVKVVLIGQDPYPGEGHAHGLSFSVKPGTALPPSLRNIFKELKDDIGCVSPVHGNLSSWARQGVLMLNAVLTVRQGYSNSHAGRGWEEFTDAVVRHIAGRADPAVFLLWGNYARRKCRCIDETKHVVLKTAHPSPLSARKFFGSRPFSAVNEALVRLGKEPINWQLD